MVFKRRKSLPIARKIREGLFPEKGWSRAAEYMMARIKRLPDSPKNISFGVAIGVFVSFSPFFGTGQKSCLFSFSLFNFHFWRRAEKVFLSKGSQKSFVYSLAKIFFFFPFSFSFSTFVE